MASNNINQGMNPVKSLNDHAYSGTFIWLPIVSGYNANIFVGTPVTNAASGYINVGGANAAIIGSARAFKDFTVGGTGIVAPSANQGVIPTTLQQYWAANTVKPTGVQTYVAVQVDKETLYDMQADSAISGGLGFVLSDYAKGFSFGTTSGFGAGDGNTSTGYSTTRLIAGNTTTSNMQLVGLAPNIGNTWGTALNNGLFRTFNSKFGNLVNAI